VAAAALLLGCTSTVIPRQVSDSQASFDGNAQNSGFLGFDTDGNGILTAHARDRYNGLVSIYGGRFSPPLTMDAGIRAAAGTNTFTIDAEHLVKFATMNRWRKEGR
jgi:hypothetical protein